MFKCTLQTPTTGRDASYKVNVVAEARIGGLEAGANNYCHASLDWGYMTRYCTPDTMVEVGNESRWWNNSDVCSWKALDFYQSNKIQKVTGNGTQVHAICWLKFGYLHLLHTMHSADESHPVTNLFCEMLETMVFTCMVSCVSLSFFLKLTFQNSRMDHILQRTAVTDN